MQPDHDVEMGDAEMDDLADQMGQMFINVNDLHLNDNCYYCSVAGALNMSVSQLVNTTGVMQVAGGGNPYDIAEIITAAGIGQGQPSATYADINQTLNGAAQNGWGHFLLDFAHAGGRHMIRVGWNGANWQFVDDQNIAPSNTYPANFATWGASDFRVFPVNTPF